MFSTKRPFASDNSPTNVNATKIDNNEAINNKFDITFHLLGTDASIVFDGFLYIYE